MSKSLAHSIRLYFPYTFDSNALPQEYTKFSKELTEIKIKDLLQNASFINNNVHKNFLDSPVWEHDVAKLDKRMHEFSRKLINGVQDIPFSDGFFGMPPVRLSNDAIRVLNQGSPSDLGCGITFSLKKSAISRLADKGIEAPLSDQNWPLMFNSVWFYGLNTGIGMMVVDVSFRQPGKNGISIQTIEELQEINYVISRNSADHQSAELYWNNVDVKTGKDTIGQSIKGMSKLIDVLIPNTIGNGVQLQATNDRKNTYAYTFVATEQPLSHDERQKYTFRVARKYNELYLPESTEQQIDYFEPFKPITHAFSLEGAVTFIDFACCIQNIPESIVNFDKTAIPSAYAPLILFTYSEYIFLREMATNTPDEERVDMRNPTNENLNKLRDFRSKLYDFRLNYRYTQISGNTNHNLFCNANKKALEIEELLVETSNDAQEIEQYIADHVSQKQDARIKKFGILGSLFAVVIGWVDLWGLNLNDIIFSSGEINKSSLTVFIAGLVLLGAAVIYTSKEPSTKNKKREKSD